MSTSDLQPLVPLDSLTGSGQSKHKSFLNLGHNTESSSRSISKPTRKSLYDIQDVAAIIISLICLIIAIVVISPALPFAAELQYTKQIIIIGFVLGVMNQCQQKILPFLLLLIEAHVGQSTLQNYDGILRWAPTADHLNFIWRFIIFVSLLLPLALGVAYKRFTGGLGQKSHPSFNGWYAPTAPPGLQSIGSVGIMSNATVPFMSFSSNESLAVSFDEYPAALGFNILLLSNDTAASLDGPVPSLVSHWKNKLTLGTAYYLTADVRGTVAKYNATAETHRNNTAFWHKYFSQTSPTYVSLYNGYMFGFMNIPTAGTDDPLQWDASWAFAGTFPTAGVDQSNSTQMNKAFQQTALGFVATRHQCRGTWKITSTSIELSGGSCDDKPLGWQYQYLSNSELALGQTFTTLLNDYLSPFATTRNQSLWKTQTYAVSLASMWESRVAFSTGGVPVQLGGDLWSYWNTNRSSDWSYNETYFVRNCSLYYEAPTLDPRPTLYLTLALQPFLTILIFIGTIVLYKSPVGQRFGLISILAGVDRDSLDLLKGASLSGRPGRPISLKIAVENNDAATNMTSPEMLEPDRHSEPQRLRYIIGGNGKNAKINRRTQYY